MPVTTPMSMPTSATVNASVGETKAPVIAKVKKSDDSLFKSEGRKIVAEYSDEMKSKMGAKSHTIVFQNLIGLASKKETRAVTPKDSNGVAIKDEKTGKALQERDPIPAPIGVEFKFTEETRVPVLPVEVTPVTGVEDDQIQYITVPAGTVRALTFMEAMYLLARTEYSGTFSAENGKSGFLGTKANNYKKTQKTPTPTINLYGDSSKSTTIPVDILDADGRAIGMKEGYERFEYFIKRKSVKPQRVATAKVEVPTAYYTSAALRKVLKIDD